MEENIGLVEAFNHIQTQFYTNPSKSLQPWVDVDDDTAHLLIMLVNRLLAGDAKRGNVVFASRQSCRQGIDGVREEIALETTLRKIENPLRVAVVENNEKVLDELFQVIKQSHKPIH